MQDSDTGIDTIFNASIHCLLYYKIIRRIDLNNMTYMHTILKVQVESALLD